MTACGGWAAGAALASGAISPFPPSRRLAKTDEETGTSATPREGVLSEQSARSDMNPAGCGRIDERRYSRIVLQSSTSPPCTVVIEDAEIGRRAIGLARDLCTAFYLGDLKG